MKSKNLRIRGVILTPDRTHGRRTFYSTPTITQHASLYEARRLREEGAAFRWLNHGNPQGRSGFAHAVARATRTFLTAIGIW